MTTEKKETNTEIAHKNALAIAKTIEQVMGKDFFTIDQMRKKMIVPAPNRKDGRALSWSEARGYINSLIPYGLIEQFTLQNKTVPDTIKIRLDYEFQINYLNHQVTLRDNEIFELNFLIDEIKSIHCPKDVKHIDLKNPSAGKVVQMKQDIKKVSTPKTPTKAVKKAAAKKK